MNNEITFSFNPAKETAKIIDAENGLELVSLDRKNAMWLAEKIIKQFGFNLN